MAGSQPLRIGPQAGPQAELIACPAQEIFYGGARGGGKSFGVLLDWLEHARRHGPQARGILFRRTLGELEDIIDKSQRIYPPFGAVFREQRKLWRFNNGAVLRLRFLDRDSHAQRYQGHEYTWMAFDEAGNWPTPKPLDKLKACLRSASGVPPRLLYTGNPGGPGHQWLKSRFVDPTPPRVVRVVGEARGKWHRVFIPARVSDNRILMDNDPGYVQRLKQSGPAWLVKAWLEGDWSVAAGGALSDLWRQAVHVLPPFPIPPAWPLDRSLDWGSARPFSVGWWARCDGGVVDGPGGSSRCFPNGTLIRVAELYGYNGSPDQGCRLPADQAARRILDLEREHPLLRGRPVRPGPADPAIYADTGGETIADMMARAGLNWIPAAKGPGSRKAGLEALRRRLAAALAHPVEEPAIHVLDTCRHFIRTVPVLPRDQADPEDVDTTAEDHVYDETRYRLMTPPRRVGRLKILGV